jgi:hypothetical protein
VEKRGKLTIMLSQLQRSQLNSVRNVGGDPSVYLSDSELTFLLTVVLTDLTIELPSVLTQYVAKELLYQSFYDVPISTIRDMQSSSDIFQISTFESVIADILKVEPDVFTYFIALGNLHAQRRKYHLILEQQSIPELETVIPRGLLEMGGLPVNVLASWLVWRKFIYDIDNRSAQTTGYLFEPILSLALGGASYGAKNSPIKRGGKSGGRQVDCIVGTDAYEFKMRVTIAASGQGRFAEELSFAEDCQLSGFRPILLVLDPTPSLKLEGLSTKYRAFGGEAYSGNNAWLHLEEKAGKIMSLFIEKYIRKPISIIDGQHAQLLPMKLEHDPSNEIKVSVGNYSFKIR